MNLRFFLLFFVLLCVWPLTADAGAWPDDKIGSGFGVQAKPERTGPTEMDAIKATGFNYIRYDMRWDDVEHARGVYTWTKFDNFIGNLHKAGLKSVVILNGVNGLYSEKVDVPPELSYGATWSYAAPSNEESVRAFAAFAVAAIQRYGTDDIIWELWNEPDGVAFWPPKPDATAFSRLADITCRAMRAAAPRAMIIGPAVARLPSRADFLHRNFFQTFIQSPVKDCLNAISVHPYRHNRAPETVIDDYDSKVRPFVQAYLPKDKKPLPIIDGEWGYSMTDVTPEQQADFALRMHLSNLLAGVPLSILYEWQDTADTPDDRERHFGIVDADGHDKAGAMLLKRILPQIKDAVIEKRLPVDDEDCYVALLRQSNGKHQLLAWLGTMETDIHRTLTIREAEKNPSSSYDLSAEPRLITINSPAPQLAVIKDAVKPTP